MLGMDSVISLNNELINKPKSREEVFLNLKIKQLIHYLISSVCISKNGSMIWNHTDSELKMKNLTDDFLSDYLSKKKLKHCLLMVFIKLSQKG